MDGIYLVELIEIEVDFLCMLLQAQTQYIVTIFYSLLEPLFYQFSNNLL
jgi:hypothetical protein